jgi:hypothetical protein
VEQDFKSSLALVPVSVRVSIRSMGNGVQLLGKIRPQLAMSLRWTIRIEFCRDGHVHYPQTVFASSFNLIAFFPLQRSEYSKGQMSPRPLKKSRDQPQKRLDHEIHICKREGYGPRQGTLVSRFPRLCAGLSICCNIWWTTVPSAGPMQRDCGRRGIPRMAN